MTDVMALLGRRRFPEWPLGCWPDEAQLWLLKACLLDDDGAAGEAWHRWEARVEWDNIDPGSLKLLPLLYRRLTQLGCRGPGVDRLKAVSRILWARGQVLLRELRPILRACREAGVEALLLKGAALDGTAYPPGVRVMEDLDVMVRREQAAAAVAAVNRLGWETRYRLDRRLVAVTHSLPFRKGNLELDLHWDLCHGRFLGDAAQRDLFAHANSVVMAGEPARVLCPADQLLHACEHGVRYNRTPPLRWLADAWMLLRGAAGPIDWRRVAAMARRHRMALGVRETLAYLAMHFGLSAGGARMMGWVESGPVEALEHLMSTRRPWGGHVFWHTLPANVFHWLRLRRVRRGVGLEEYLRKVNNLSGSLAAHVARLIQVGVATRRGRAAAADGTLALDLADAPEETLTGFHPPEAHGGTAFRWAEPVASIELSPRPAAGRVAFVLAPLRAWYGDLDGALAVRFNRHIIPREAQVFDGWKVSFAVEPGMFGGGAQRLEFRCRPWAAALGDPRSLGLPLRRVEVTGQ